MKEPREEPSGSVRDGQGPQPGPIPRHEPALTRDPRVLLALAVVLLGFLGGLALLLFLIATDV